MKRLMFLLIALIAFGPLCLFAQFPLAKLTSDEVQQNNAFGDAVVIDGDYAVVGAFLDTNEHGEKAGAAYIFRREGETWTQQARLVGSGVGAEDRFGEALDLDGDYLLAANRSEANTGAVYVFKREGNTWSEQTRLTVNDLQADERLGTTVLFQDPYAFIGGRSVRVFKREGDTWVHQAKLTTDTGEDVRPQAVSGDYLIASRSFINAGGTASVQEIYVFKRGGETWTQQAQFSGDDVGAGEWRGVNATLSGDYLAIGAGSPGSQFDTIYVFKQEELGWVYQTEFTSQDPATVNFSIAEMVMAGDVLLVGDNNQNLNGENSGAAYVFRREGDTWSELAKLVPGDGVAHDRFGISVAIDDPYLMVGQDGHQVGDTLPTGFGSAYVYSLTDIIATGLEEAPVSFGYEVSAPYPNPFSTQTTFTLSVEQRQHVTVGVYDLLGRLVVVLYNGVLRANTPHPFTVTADGLPSGMYLIRVSSESGAASQSLFLVK